MVSIPPPTDDPKNHTLQRLLRRRLRQAEHRERQAARLIRDASTFRAEAAMAVAQLGADEQERPS